MSLLGFVRRLAGVVALSCSAPALAATGLEWLATQQSVDGSYGLGPDAIATPFVTTVEVVRADVLLGETGSLGFQSALLFLAGQSEADTELLARKLVVAAYLGELPGPELGRLLSQQGEDGGFGAGPGYESSVFDTAAALEALALVMDPGAQQAAAAVAFLTTHQQGSGGWSDGPNDASVSLTAASMRALWPYRGTYLGVSEALTRAQGFLLARRMPDALWGEEDFVSAQAIIALSQTVADPFTLASSAAALEGRQRVDGSWAGDAYTTALVLQALRLQAARQSESAPQTGAISGYVVRAGSTEPVAGALVTADPSGAAVLTNADGYYLLSPLQPGSYTVTASKAGFTPAATGAQVEAGGVTVAPPLVLGFTAQAGLVIGKVFVAATQQPLAGVQVALSGPATYSVLTDGTGAFDFGPVAPGTYTLRFDRTGYLAVSGTAAVVGGQTLSAQIGMNPAGGWVDDTPGTISGRIVDGRTGLPIAGAVVDLGSGLSAVAGTDGGFSIASVPRGAYAGMVAAAGYQAVRFTLAFSAGASGDLGTVTLFPAATSTPPTSLTLHGLVSDGVTGAPIVGAAIAVAGTDATATTGADGRFVVSGITLLAFDVAVSASGYTPATYGVRVAAFGDAEVTLQLSPPGGGGTASTLAGTVTEEGTGAPIAGAQVAIAGTALAALTGSDGRYALSGVDRLEFTVDVSAVGHLQQSYGVKLSAHGSYALDPVLPPVPAAGFQVVSVRAAGPAYPANTTALFTAKVASVLPSSTTALVLGEVQDATGTPIAKVMPYAEGTTTPVAEFAFDAGEEKTLVVPWSTAQFPPGTYRLVLRVVEPGTITRATPLGEVLAENSGTTGVVTTPGIAGGLALDPPMTQAGLPTPVVLAALVQNAGNAPLAAGAYVLTVVKPDTGATLLTASADAPALEVGAHSTLQFGDWVPTDAGNLKVTVRAATAGVRGEVTGTLYVGDKASGTFTVDRTVVPEGTSTVHATVAMQGVDVTRGSSTDPMFSLVKEAVRKGGVYTAAQARAWDQANRCLGCHIHSQSLLGLQSSVDKAEVDPAAIRYLYNVTVTSQRSDGVLRNQYPTYPKSQTLLGLWSLRATPDRVGAFRVKYRAARYLQTIKVPSGDGAYWTTDNAAGWWASYDANTTLAIQGFASILRDAAQIDLSAVRDYTLGRTVSYGAGTAQGMTVGPDGALYVATSSGTVNRVDLETGAVTARVSGLPSTIRGVAFAADGTLWVTNTSNPTVIRITPDGARTNFNLGGQLTDAAIGPDGLLYAPDLANKRIVRVNASGQLEVWVSGGLLNGPSAVAFDAGGNLLVANQTSYDILRIAPDRSVEVYAEQLAYRPVRLALAGDGSVYVTVAQPEINGGVVRIFPDRTATPVLQQEGLLSVVEAGSRVWIANTTASAHSLSVLDTPQLDTGALPALQSSILQGARYLLAHANDGSTDNYVQAVRLIGLSEAREFVDATLASQIDSTVAAIATRLRARQRTDGGWGRYTSYSSDPLVTAMVGIALEYTNPSADDPQIRKAIQYELNTQRADGSWDNVSNGFGTRLASTSFVMIFMPKALERLGGIDIDLHVDMPASIQLSGASIPPTSAVPGPGGTTSYLWQLEGVTSAGRDVKFDLALLDMALHEARPVAVSAYLEFDNSFVAERVQVPLDVPVVEVKSAMDLAVGTDRARYGADEPVEVGATVTNVGPTAASGQVLLTIRPAGGGEPVAVLPALPVTELAAGAQLRLLREWNTGATLAGGYEVQGTLLDARGRVLAEAVAPFDIDAPPAVGAISVATDRPVYDAWDVVGLTVHVENVARNAALAPSRVELEVRTPAGETLFTATREVVELAPGGVVTLPFGVKLVDAAAGTYPVTAVLRDSFTRTLLATGTTAFQVERRPMVSLAGSANVRSPVVYVGDENACTDAAWNVAGAAVPGVTLIHRLVDVDSSAVVTETTETVELAGGSVPHRRERAFSTAGFAPGGYACILDAQLGGETRTLGFAGFRVLEPPIRLNAAIAQGGRGRLLVLLDAPTWVADPLGPDTAPPLAIQRAFLEELLTQAGWSYTITETAADFTRELHTGGYVEYALFSEHEKLSEPAQKELREAVFRGEGVLVAGVNDWRNHGLGDALGVKFVGHLSQVEGVRLGALEFPLLAGTFGALEHERPEHVERVVAESLGVYLPETSPAIDALTLNAYGRGRAAFAGVDLLAIGARDGQSSTAADALRALLGLVQPDSIPTAAGAVVPVTVTVGNEGIAVNVVATVTLPDGVRVVDQGPGLVDGQRLVFEFPLGAGEVRTVRFWMRLPEEPGTVTLQLVVNGTAGGSSLSIPVTAALSVEDPPALGRVQGGLDALVAGNHADAVAIARASNSLTKALAPTDPAQAVPEVLKATDALVGIADPSVVDLRVELGRWLRWATLGTE